MKISRITAFLCCFFIGTVFAATPNPMVMLQTISNKMVQSLRQNRPQLKSNPKLVYRLVNSIIVPHADVAGMSRAVLGRNAWNSASASQQRAFQSAFKDVVINTYESALNAYTNETIKFNPLRESYEGKTQLQVQSYVIRQDGPPVSLNYRVVLKGGRWLLFDLNVEGVSMLQSFKAQFASQLSRGMTVAQITNNLRKRSAR